MAVHMNRLIKRIGHKFQKFLRLLVRRHGTVNDWQRQIIEVQFIESLNVGIIPYLAALTANPQINDAFPAMVFKPPETNNRWLA